MADIQFKPYRAFNPVNPEWSGITYQDLVKPVLSSSEDSAIVETVSSTLTTVTTAFTFGASALFQDGSEAAPGIAFANDTDTGWYRIGSGNVGFSADGTLKTDWSTARMKLATGYFLQMGPNLHNFGGNDDYLVLTDTINGAVRISARNLSSGTASHSTISAMNNTGNECSIGFGSSAFTAYPPHVAEEGFVIVGNGGGTGSGNPTMMIGNRRNGYVRFISNDVERMRILSGGPVLVNYTVQASSEQFGVSGASYLGGATTVTGLLTGNASLDITGTGTFSSTVTTSRLLAGYTTRTISGGGGQVYCTASPGNSQCQIFFDLREEGTNEKLWDLNPVLKTFSLRCINDANTLAHPVWTVTRSGYVPTSFVINDDGEDCDFIVESDSVTNAISMDGATGVTTFGAQVRVGSTTDTSATGDFASGSSTALNGMWFASSVTTANAQNTSVMGIGVSRATVTTNLGTNSWGSVIAMLTEAEDANSFRGEYRGTINSGFWFRPRRSRPTTLTTQTGDILGGMYVEGYTTAPASAPAFGIEVTQDGAAGASGVPGKVTISTYTSALATAAFIHMNAAGNIGVNTTGPDRKFDILDASNPQLRLTYTDGSVYTDLQTTSSGDLKMIPSSTSDSLYFGKVWTSGTYVGITDRAPDTTSFILMTKTATTDRYLNAVSSGTMFFTVAVNEVAKYTASAFTINDTQADIDFRIEGDSISHLFFTDATATTENIAVFAAAAPNWQTMDRGFFVGDTTNAPTGNPTSGGFLYASAGAGVWRGSGGTTTTFAAAGPHCGKCGYDFWSVCCVNEKWGAYLRKCGWCGKEYKKGPKSVLRRLTKQQKSEVLNG